MRGRAFLANEPAQSRTGLSLARFHRLSGLGEVPPALRGSLVAIGNFDGFHRGHQRVFAELKARAAARGVPAVVVTFEPHPRDVFAPAPFMFRLTEANAKGRLAEALGLDGIIVLDFTREFAQTEAEDFVGDFLVGALAVSGVIVGADFMFGRGRRGTPEFLRTAGETHGFAVETLPLLEDGGEPVSSSRVRAALNAGEVETANGLLGYHWFISGEVVLGDQRGRSLGYPTANIATPEGFLLAQGVYAVRGQLGERVLDGVAAYGKPMFDNRRPPFETFFFDFDEDIYGRVISVALMGRVRGQEVFPGLPELIAAMGRDCARAREILGQAQPLGELDRKLGFFG